MCLQVEPGEVAGQIARLLLGEVDALDVLGRVRAVPPGLSMIANCVFGYCLRDLSERSRHQEADRDDELVAGLPRAACRFGM